MALRPLIIDCDPGTDDAVALLLAIAHADIFKILGLSTVGGNVSLELVTLNALKVCELAGRPDIPVYAGCSRPLVKDLHTAELVHGECGMNGSNLPYPQIVPQKKHGVDFIIDTLKSYPEKVTLVPIGPLTNIAMALIKEPSIKDHIEEIVFMGGAMHGGNMPGGFAEFNIYNDPHAAHVVFTSGVKLTMVGLDVTHKAILTLDWLEKIHSLNTAVAKMIYGMLSLTATIEKERFNFSGCLVHDACAIGYLLRPDLFKGRYCPLFVEILSSTTLGQTVVDWDNWKRNPANAFVLYDIDREGFMELLYESLKGYPLSSVASSNVG